MKLLLLMLLSGSIYSADSGGTPTPPPSKMPSRRNSAKITRQISQEDLEKAVVQLKEELKKNKGSCCVLNRTHVGLISSAISSGVTAAITIATMYSRCHNSEQPPQ